MSSEPVVRLWYSWLQGGKMWVANRGWGTQYQTRGDVAIILRGHQKHGPFKVKVVVPGRRWSMTVPGNNTIQWFVYYD